MPSIASSAARTGALVGVWILAAVTLLGCDGGGSSTASPPSPPPSASPPSAIPSPTSTLLASTPSPSRPSASSPSSTVALAIHDGSELSCTLTSDGATCSVQGTAHIDTGIQLLLWVEPVSPHADSPGYFIQRGVDGVTRQPRSGPASAWEGVIQIGNAIYPPCQGDTLNIIVTAVDANAAADLLNGPQTELDPTGLQQTVSYAEADNLSVSGVPSCQH